MKKHLLATGLLLSTSVYAAEIQLSVEIPAIDTAEYHRPYVAAWLEDGNKKLTEHLFVWYQDGDRADRDKGEEWLKDLRRWWRRGGRGEDMPIDGVSGATKTVGKHTVSFAADSQVMQNLSDGNYTLSIEASRENGGREVVKIPFNVPFDSEKSLSASGESELGEITVKLIP